MLKHLLKKYTYESLIVLYSLFLLLLICSISRAQCPDEGLGKTEDDKKLNRLKNRNIVFTPVENKISLQDILKQGEDEFRFKNNDYVGITGYIVEVKEGGKESCNCNAKQDSLKDEHIYIGIKPTSKKEECMIVEITPKFKKLNPSFNPKKHIGKKVRIYGWMLWDHEHKGNASNTCKSCKKIWRRTAWEI